MAKSSLRFVSLAALLSRLVSADAQETADTLNLISDVLGSLGLVFGVLTAYLAILFFRNQYLKLLAEKTKREEEEAARHNGEIPALCDFWEVNRDFVNILYSVKLGKGAFGVVHLGQIKIVDVGHNSNLNLNDGSVAVKMLRDNVDKLDNIEFLREIEIMKSIGFHERLDKKTIRIKALVSVNIIACITNSEPNLLITEYCLHGDLLKYMRERRQYMITLPRDVEYGEYAQYVDLSMVLSQEQLLQYAAQAACGLEYLSAQGFIHRDIAARNDLIDDRNRCKIGDFGLCRKVQEDHPVYQTRGLQRFPVKWMAPEALKRYETSTASDVWPFGILLFEIITLGGTPYPEWEHAEVLPRLEAGERMQRPDNCPDSVFEIMNECWKREPEHRPTITDLKMRLEKEVNKTPNEYYIGSSEGLLSCTTKQRSIGFLCF